MIKVTIDLDGAGQQWRIKGIFIALEDDYSLHVGAMNEWRSYRGAVKEAKRRALLAIRQRRAEVTEKEVIWKVHPAEQDHL